MVEIEVYDEYTNSSVPACIAGPGCTGCGVASTTSTPANLVVSNGGSSSTTAGAGTTGPAGHCPWGGTLLRTITVYDDGTITVV